MQSGSIPDLEKEVSCVPVAESKSPEALDHVVRALNPAGIYREAGMIQDSIHMGRQPSL